MSKTKKINSGDVQTQIENFTNKINIINAHLKNNKKDHSSRRGLLLMVSKRRKLLKYFQRKDLECYRTLTDKLKIRK